MDFNNHDNEDRIGDENHVDTENSIGTESSADAGNGTDSGNGGSDYNGNNNHSYGSYGNSNPYGNPYNPGQPIGNPPYGYRYSQPYVMPGQNLANAAMILGIISILSTILMTVYIPLALGSIAIILAILSKGTKSHIAGQAMTGLVCGIGGLVMNLGILVTSLTIIFSNPKLLRDAARTYDAQFEQIYGESTEDVLGQSLEDMISETFGLE